jgi:uncharacterized protein with PQ loop repeat
LNPANTITANWKQVGVFTEIVGWIAAVLAAIYILPQAIRVIRTKNTKGVSDLTATLLISFSVLWAVYGFSIGSAPTVLASAFAIIQEVALLILLFIHRSVKTTSVLAGVTIIAVGVLFTAFEYMWLLGLFISVSTMVSYIPQVVTTLRHPDITGISPWFLVVSMLNGASWLAYGILLADIPVIVWGASATALFVLNTVAWFLRRTKPPRSDIRHAHVTS